MEPRLPVLDSFTISTPSLSVVISADDSPLPPHVQPQPVPAHLLTVHSLQPRGPAEGASEAGGEELEAAAAAAAAAAEQQEEQQQQQELEAAALQRQQQQQRLLHLNSQKQLSQEELRELKALQEREQQQQQQELLLLQQQQQLDLLLRRADSRHADRVYRHPGAPPPIQQLQQTPQNENSEDLIKRISTFETKDFTFWDKLRRHNTQTLIRRWRSYVPSGQEDSAFYLRSIRLPTGPQRAPTTSSSSSSSSSSSGGVPRPNPPF
ncbi:hypothetical protein, conserved [Eimeria necatrix]|uniref:Uncharacterized protein n=1 Tax=Eimeria necatrix TaxID=51315 RepID=U6MPD3_9EIME|nr:hypothetical protein, conserved [Eimeria necatrix]CDJ64344.1 hypothetical protein, conserved [Eimeria necatrix]